MSIEDIYNYVKVDDRLITGGHPTAEQLRAVAAAGFTTVINLSTYNQGYSLEGEEEIVTSLGMAYTNIPVDWNNPTDDDFTAFEQAMKLRGDAPLFLHCAANYRVTAFYSLYARKYLGWSAEQAAAFRTQIWALDHYPPWDAFIARQTAEIEQSGAG